MGVQPNGNRSKSKYKGAFVVRGSNLQVHMGRDVRLRVSIFVALEDPVVKIQHIVHLEALLLTFPEGMPLPGVRREAGAAVKSFIQCIPKVGS